MTSFRNLVIGTNLVVGLGLLLVVILPEYSMFSSVGKILVIVGIFANIYLALSLVSCGIMGVRA
jgi:hypothetical protein